MFLSRSTVQMKQSGVVDHPDRRRSATRLDAYREQVAIDGAVAEKERPDGGLPQSFAGGIHR